MTEEVAPNYWDMITHSMDLRTMELQVQVGSYPNYAWVRDSFELMVWNALTFNRPNSKLWCESKRYHKTYVENIFHVIG